MAKLPPQPMGVPPGSSYWNDWYEKLRTFVETITSSVDWSIITGKPTTLAGYGITNGQTTLVNSAGLAAALSDETGTGLAVFNTSPSLVTPNIGAATGTSLATTGNISSNTDALFVDAVNKRIGIGTNVPGRKIVAQQAGDTRIVVGDTATFSYNFSVSHVSVGAGFGCLGREGLGPLITWDSNGNTRFGISVAPTGVYRVEIDGALSVSSTTMIRTATSFTNGAGAALGTLTNAPVAGPPTKWIPINDNGTTRYIPAW